MFVAAEVGRVRLAVELDMKSNLNLRLEELLRLVIS